MIESIEKLREWAKNGNGVVYYEYGVELADEIEREISERYMELPVDADGVPIHVGDILLDLETPRHVVGIGKTSILLGGYPSSGEQEVRYALPCNYRHVKPDPIKELLEEFGNAVSKQGVDFDMLDAIDEYADKLREAVER